MYSRGPVLDDQPSGQSKVIGNEGWSPKRCYFIMYQVCSGQGLVLGEQTVFAEERFHCMCNNKIHLFMTSNVVVDLSCACMICCLVFLSFHIAVSFLMCRHPVQRQKV